MVDIADRELPAVRYLATDAAIDVLRPPVEASGGRIESVHPVHVQYRPGSDVVVRYSAQISWSGAPVRRETLAAASTIHGTHPGTVVVAGDTPRGPIEVGVWRWPFDPVLVGLDGAVRPDSIGERLGLEPERIGLSVVAYRPTERAVIRVADRDHLDDAGHELVHAYVKVVPPTSVLSIVERHSALLDVGVPAPGVLQHEEAAGVLVLEPLRGPTLRHLVKTDTVGWPPTEEFEGLAAAFSAAQFTGPRWPSRLTDGVLHGEMLTTVVPEQTERLRRLGELFAAEPVAEIDGAVHGDLHDAQLIVRDGRIVGVLDIDDAAPGAAIDDYANLIARLLYRLVTEPGVTPRLAPYLDQLRRSGMTRFGTRTTDLHTAASLVGLATGPFRLQSVGWRTAVDDVLATAAQLAEGNMRTFSE